MYLPNISEEGISKAFIDQWLGYNHNYKVGDGEFFDSNNLSSDQFPLLSPRKARTNLTNLTEEGDDLPVMRGVIQVGTDIWALWDKYLWNISTDIQTDISDILDGDYTSEQTLLVMGSYLLMFPLKAYINLNDLTDMGLMEAEFEAPENITITYTPCSLSGAALQNLTVASTSPATPAHGDYWICTATDKEGLYCWNDYQSEWEAVAVSYIKIGIPGATLTDYFEEGDAVFLNTNLPDINEGSVIQVLDDEYMVVIGFMDQASASQSTSSSWTLTAKRKLPHLDVVCCDKNRVWGCHYGYDSSTHKVVNEIYASKLGDFKNWYVYSGLSTDSYALTIGDMGEFTGAISFQGYPHFFKEDKIYKIYGSYPAEYQLVQMDAEGVQKGSEKSLVVIGQYLLYKGVSDVCVFDGSRPVAISIPLSREDMFYDAVAGGCLNKYYVIMETTAGAKRMFVYDLQYGMWEKEEPIAAFQFTRSVDGQLYAASAYNIWGLGTRNNAAYANESALDEEWVEWSAETGELGYSTPNKKYVSHIAIRAFIPTRSEFKVEISYDDRPYDEVGVLRGNSDIGSQTLAFAPFRCDHYRIRFSGHGECRVYSMSTTTEYGSEE